MEEVWLRYDSRGVVLRDVSGCWRSMGKGLTVLVSRGRIPSVPASTPEESLYGIWEESLSGRAVAHGG